ncbi:MAG: gamma-glutamyltransferase [Leptolyngbya sp. PLA2]|nr:gamma-glutamyltransferase [Leptolyngbya sp.]MCE7971926.1 gamma-glutamyltransferase [Leptolyngbya sp. PL-A2]MCQ3939710.1 gamma-glutamyltransferase [cyanobacterium CYA1]MCZ7632042.1 gamma-glutamyltransferase [Phycisphaerales bacterium]MDL1903967.1 gamma-glutamyltransferase [Synechococcales cyanobacterium CNB]
MRVVRFFLAVVLVLAPSHCRAQQHAAHYTHGAVAAAHPVASEAGAAMLRAGGNAVDAAVAASFALSVVRPQSCGVGGGGFMVIYLPNDPLRGRIVTAINYRETAPAAATPDMFQRASHEHASTRTGLAIAVPGTVAGLLHALERYGTMERAAVLAPAIAAARDGFITDGAHAAAAREVAPNMSDEEKRRSPLLWRTLLREGAIRPGDRIVNEPQARLLEAIAERGAAAFYDAPELPDAAAAAGGVITRDDMLGYAPVEVSPLVFEFAGRTFLAMPPPSSGGLAMAQSLLMLERVAGPMTGPRPPDTDFAHLLVESLKHAFADRAEWLGDPAFVDVPVQRLLSPEYLDARAATIDRERTRPSHAYGTREAKDDAPAAPPPDDAGTSHLCAVDQWGGAVACTETINLSFGSRITVEAWGICLNNEMDDFTARPGEPNAFGLRQSARNAPAPGKRPLSSMSPTIVLDAEGRVEAVAGAAGGPRIITATAQCLLNALVRGLDAGHAVAAPRLHHQWLPDRLLYETSGAADSEHNALIGALAARGHDVERTGGIGVAQLIVRTSEGWHAACDPRHGGRPAGH